MSDQEKKPLVPKDRKPLQPVTLKNHEQLADLGREHFSKLINCTAEDHESLGKELNLSKCEFSRLRVMVQSAPNKFKPKDEPRSGRPKDVSPTPEAK